MENVWLNLPVQDLDRTEKFYKAIGFEPNGKHFKKDELVSFLAGSNQLIVHFFKEEILAKSMMGAVADTSKGNEIIITIGSKSKEEIAEITEKAKQNGGEIHQQPQESPDGYYGSMFSDPDGHKWNLLLLEKGM